MTSPTMTYKEKMKDLKCVIIIPTYNNSGTILKVIADVRRYASDVIVVDDGSTDNTSKLLKELNDIRLIGYPDNKGKGYALKKGLKQAYKLGYRYAITIDADGQHYADDIPVFIDRIEQKPDSLLIGARNFSAENMPSKNRFANKFSNFWYKIETGRKLSDTQSGYRLYPLEKLHGIRYITRGYEFEVEVIVRAAWRGVNVENVPVKVYYAPPEKRVSHFKPLRDFTRISILNTVLVLFAILFYYPWKFIRSLTWSNIKNFFETQVIHSKDSNLKMAASMGWGVFCGIIPTWGYQMVFAGFTAHFLKLNEVLAIVFSNVSIPPMIPIILYGSMATGAYILNIENIFSLGTVSFESIGLSLWQYLVGSLALAALSGLAMFSISFLLMSIFKRNSNNG